MLEELLARLLGIAQPTNRLAAAGQVSGFEGDDELLGGITIGKAKKGDRLIPSARFARDIPEVPFVSGPVTPEGIDIPSLLGEAAPPPAQPPVAPRNAPQAAPAIDPVQTAALPRPRVGMSQHADSAGYGYGPGAAAAARPVAPVSAPQAFMGYPAPSSLSQGNSGGFLGNLLGQRKSAGNQTIGYLMRNGLDEGTAAMVASDPELLQGFLKERMKGQEPQKPIEINGRLVDPTNYQVLADFSTPKEEKRPWTALSEGEIAALGLPPGTYQRSPEGKVEPTVTPRGQDADFGRLQDVRKEIQQLPSYKNFAQAAPIYDTMVDAAGRDSKAADLNLIYGLGKIFDPGSVVREGEMTMVKDTASWPDWLIGSLNSVDGGARLQPATRKMILQEARSRIEAYKGMLDGDMAQYQQLAEHFKLDPAFLLPPMPKLRDLPQFGAPPPSGLPLPPQGAVSQMPRGPVQRIAPRVPPTTQTAPSEVIPWTEWMKR